MSIGDPRISDSRYNKTTGYNSANNYGPAKTVEHTGMTNDAFDQFYAEISAREAQIKAKKGDSLLMKGLKNLVRKVFK